MIQFGKDVCEISWWESPSAHTAQISSKSNPSLCAIPCWPPRQISTARSWGSSSQAMPFT